MEGGGAAAQVGLGSLRRLKSLVVEFRAGRTGSDADEGEHLGFNGDGGGRVAREGEGW